MYEGDGMLGEAVGKPGRSLGKEAAQRVPEAQPLDSRLPEPQGLQASCFSKVSGPALETSTPALLIFYRLSSTVLVLTLLSPDV